MKNSFEKKKGAKSERRSGTSGGQTKMEKKTRTRSNLRPIHGKIILKQLDGVFIKKKNEDFYDFRVYMQIEQT